MASRAFKGLLLSRRGSAKNKLRDLHGAVADLTEAIENAAFQQTATELWLDAHRTRAASQFRLRNVAEARADLTVILDWEGEGDFVAVKLLASADFKHLPDPEASARAWGGGMSDGKQRETRKDD